MPWAAKSSRPRIKRHARTTTERGYGWDWQQLRTQILRQDPLCKDCEVRGIVTPATELHHVHKVIHKPELRMESDNLMPLCGRCHDERTAKGE